MVSQSGGFGFSVMNLAAHDGGLHFRQMVTTGNEIGVSYARFHRLFHSTTRIPTSSRATSRALKDAQRLLEIGRQRARQKEADPAWKVGNTEQGQKAAASHTANLGGAMALYKAAFRQGGIIQVDDIQDVIDYGRAFRCGKLPRATASRSSRFPAAPAS